jgi:glutamate carboxypeptidase
VNISNGSQTHGAHDIGRRDLSGGPTLTFNPGVIAGGTDVERDSSCAMTASGKTNIISPKTIVTGDLRFLRESQTDSTRARMRVVA